MLSQATSNAKREVPEPVRIPPVPAYSTSPVSPQVAKNLAMIMPVMRTPQLIAVGIHDGHGIHVNNTFCLGLPTGT